MYVNMKETNVDENIHNLEVIFFSLFKSKSFIIDEIYDFTRKYVINGTISTSLLSIFYSEQ